MVVRMWLLPASSVQKHAVSHYGESLPVTASALALQPHAKEGCGRYGMFALRACIFSTEKQFCGELAAKVLTWQNDDGGLGQCLRCTDQYERQQQWYTYCPHNAAAAKGNQAAGTAHYCAGTLELRTGGVLSSASAT